MKGEFKKNWLAEKKLIQEAITELKTPGKRHKQIPNLLTLSRMLAPLLIIPSAMTGNFALTVGFATLSCFTDLVDGFIARNWNLTSKLGADLDAITDKVFSGTLLLTAAIPNPTLFLNLFLELVISCTNVKRRLEGVDVTSSYVGKVKTWFLFALTLLGIGSLKVNLENVIVPFSLITAAMQGFTVASYKSGETTDEKAPLNLDPCDYSDSSNELEQSKIEEKKYQLEKKMGEGSYKTPEELIEELKKMRAFFVADENESEIKKANTESFQKVKREEKS